jgi:hypothetical protein
MTKDFSKFQTIIDQFRGEVSASNFDAKFSAFTESIPTADKFLLKMELKRLASQCNRLIDLRGLVDGQCQVFEHEGRVHFFDELAIQVFEDNMQFYGSYTFGVYDAVNETKNNYRVLDDNEEKNAPVMRSQVKDKIVLKKLNYPAKLHAIGQYYNRQEERMNFVTQLTFILENKEVIDATTSDLSIHGCKFRIKSETKLKVGQGICIQFIGLENEFKFTEDLKLEYQVCNTYHDNSFQFIGVERLNHQVDDSFSQFLTDFIQRNKRRYKINLDNTINAIKTRALEQFVLPKLNELPVFIEKSERGLLPRYALTTHNNQVVFQYWQDENKKSALHCLMKKERIDYLASADAQAKTLLVFSFVHHNNGKCYFYTADEQELKTNAELGRIFLGFAASKSSFAVTQLHYLAVTPAHAESLFTVSNSLPESKEYLNLPLSDDSSSLLDSLKGIIVANDITHEQLISDYQRFTFEPLDKNVLKCFGHKRLKHPPVVDAIGINYKNQRTEPRFKYITPVSIGRERERQNVTGMLQNFSTSGMNIELDSPSTLNKGDIVYLSFVSLQKITSEFDLRQLPYEIIQVNKKKTSVRLKVYVKDHQHIGRAFFKLLIEQNKDKLLLDEYIQMIPGLSKALRNTYVNTLINLSLIIQTSGSRYKVESITSSTEESQLLTQMRQLSDQTHYANLYPILNNLQVSNALYGGLQKMLNNDQSVTDILYIAINEDIKNVESAVTTKLASELDSLALKEMFIAWALKHGRFFCIQTKLSRTNEPDMEYLDPELSYISSYSIHKGKKIEQNILSVRGVVQLIDVTKETLFRHQLMLIDE